MYQEQESRPEAISIPVGTSVGIKQCLCRREPSLEKNFVILTIALLSALQPTDMDSCIATILLLQY